MKFLIISTGRDCSDKVTACLDSIASQRGHEFHAAIVDDCSDDDTADVVRDFLEHGSMSGDASFVRTPERRGAMRNQYDQWTDTEIDYDVALWCDLDDRLAHPDVLGRLAVEYEAGALMTYGSYVSEPFASSCQRARPYPLEVQTKGAHRQWIREKRGIFHNHLRSVSRELLERVTVQDCQDGRGNWWMTGPDMAVMLPCLEMARERCAFIEDPLYIYSSDRRESEWVAYPELVRANHQEMLHRPPKVLAEPLARVRGARVGR